MGWGFFFIFKLYTIYFLGSGLYPHLVRFCSGSEKHSLLRIFSFFFSSLFPSFFLSFYISLSFLASVFPVSGGCFCSILL